MRYIILPALLVLSGCTGQNAVWLKSGEPVTRASQSFASCQAEAARVFPPDLRHDPFVIGVNVGTRICKDMICIGAAAPVARGGPTTRDLNDGARRSHFEGCMGDRGFERALLPVCPTAKALRPVKRHPDDLGTVCVRDNQLYTTAG